MSSHGRGARWERRQFRKLTKDLDTLRDLGDFGDLGVPGGPGEPVRPPRRLAKDALGAAVSLAVIGVLLLQLTDALASHCRTGPGPRSGLVRCSGVAAVAHHAQLAVTLSVAACGALAAIAFIWYMFWGYKTQPAKREEPGTL
jgi:hypothetical protein